MIMVNFDFLSKPIKFDKNFINTLCIENQELFRSVYSSAISYSFEEGDIVISENYTPVKSKNNVCVIDDFFRISYSNTIIKKLYECLDKYCNTELEKDSYELKSHIIQFIHNLISDFDYDFEFNYDINLIDLFKLVNIHPATDNNGALTMLLDYMLLLNKYSPPKLFVLLNLHLFYSESELELFYKDIINNHINLLVLENIKSFSGNKFENVIIYDKDFCEIIEI